MTDSQYIIRFSIYINPIGCFGKWERVWKREKGKGKRSACGIPDSLFEVGKRCVGVGNVKNRFCRNGGDTVSILFGFTLFLLLGSQLAASSVHLAWDFSVGWGRKTSVFISFHFILASFLCAYVRMCVQESIFSICLIL